MSPPSIFLGKTIIRKVLQHIDLRARERERVDVRTVRYHSIIPTGILRIKSLCEKVLLQVSPGVILWSTIVLEIEKERERERVGRIDYRPRNRLAVERGIFTSSLSTSRLDYEWEYDKFSFLDYFKL